MHTFLDNFHHGGKYSSQIASHQVELRREENFTDQKYLTISSLQTDYLNLDISSGFGRNSERANTVHTKWNFCGGVNHSQKNVSKGSDTKRKNLERVVIRSTDKRNGCLENILDVDLKITSLQNVQIHQRKMINGEIKYVLMKKVILHAETVRITMNKKCMHIWHVCLVMTNILVEILVTVRNWPIGFWIMGQCATWHQRFHILFQVR